MAKLIKNDDLEFVYQNGAQLKLCDEKGDILLQVVFRGESLAIMLPAEIWQKLSKWLTHPGGQRRESKDNEI